MKFLAKMAFVTLAAAPFSAPSIANAQDQDVLVMRRTVATPRPPATENPAEPPATAKYDCNYRQKVVTQYTNASASTTTIIRPAEDLYPSDIADYIDSQNYTARLITYGIYKGKLNSIILWDTTDPEFNSYNFTSHPDDGVYFCRPI